MQQKILLAIVLMSGLSAPVAGFAGLPSVFNHNSAFLDSKRRSKTSLHTGGAASAASPDFDLPDEIPDNGRRSSTDPSSSEFFDRHHHAVQRETRSRRLMREKQARSRFVIGDDLHLLRQQVLKMKVMLEEARRNSVSKRVEQLERAIMKAQAMDAEYMYKVAVDRLEEINQMGGAEKEIRMLEEEASIARTVLPQFNLEGLWVGKYGDHGYEMINVTYVGNTLIARKVTGERNVPKGEISFTVDLGLVAGQSFDNNGQQEENGPLEPIELGDHASKQWGSKYLQRYSGKGQVAAEGFVNSQWMDGQLILVKEYFSFAWLPISHQVFFGRPSDELTLKLLNEANSRKSKDAKVRDYIEKCMEETDLLDDEMEVNDGPFFSHDQQDYYTQQGCFE